MPCCRRFRVCLSHLNNTLRPCLIHISCRAPAVLRPCRLRLRKATAQHGRGTAWYVRINDLPWFGFFRLPRGVSRLRVWIFPATRGLSRRTRHCWRTVGAQPGMCELARHGTAGAQDSMCELAIRVTTRHAVQR